MRTPQKTRRQPSFSSTGRTWSRSPTETPAELTSTSARSPARRSALEVLGRVARDAEVASARRRPRGTARRSRTSSTRRCARRPAAPSGSTSSSPPERIATRGRRWTATALRPSDASMPSCDGTERAPGLEHELAGAHVLAGRAHVLAGARAARGSARRSPSRSTSSCLTTASAPGGSGAPVKMRAASPGARAPRRRGRRRRPRRRRAARRPPPPRRRRGPRRAPRSRPSPSSRPAAACGWRAPARRARARAPRRRIRAPPRGRRAASSTIARASSTESPVRIPEGKATCSRHAPRRPGTAPLTCPKNGQCRGLPNPPGGVPFAAESRPVPRSQARPRRDPGRDRRARPRSGASSS